MHILGVLATTSWLVFGYLVGAFVLSVAMIFSLPLTAIGVKVLGLD